LSPSSGSDFENSAAPSSDRTTGHRAKIIRQ
jgi:hypothetical protein